jgi:peptidoglycan/xylan/chitin deacetylase (PgdA/CDA1 family)
MRPGILSWFYPSLLWKQPCMDAVYLTFDDGPHPTITPWVLEQLKAYEAQATFFCVGDNVRKYPEVFETVKAAGHVTGNHTQHHLNGWKTEDEAYLTDIEAAAAYIGSPLFRPPYGRVTFSQLKLIREQHPDMQIVMWSLLTCDFDPELLPEECTEQTLRRIRPGDIVVFHDSEKAFPRLQSVLPAVLEHCRAKGWQMKAISL